MVQEAQQVPLAAKILDVQGPQHGMNLLILLVTGTVRVIGHRDDTDSDDDAVGVLVADDDNTDADGGDGDAAGDDETHSAADGCIVAGAGDA